MRLEQDELWLTDAISLVLSERDVPKQSKDDPDARILQSKGILIPACKPNFVFIHRLTILLR
jgi:hypothetical protein